MSQTPLAVLDEPRGLAAIRCRLARASSARTLVAPRSAARRDPSRRGLGRPLHALVRSRALRSGPGGADRGDRVTNPPASLTARARAAILAESPPRGSTCPN